MVAQRLRNLDGRVPDHRNTLNYGEKQGIINGKAVLVNGGTLPLKVTSGTATICAGVTATVNRGATLELAGSVSALSAGANRVTITNNGQVAGGGLLVSGTNQQVGNIDGSGNVTINSGASLTANHIVQNALVIGGAAGNPATVTIDASDASGNPLDAVRGGPLGEPSSGFAPANSLAPSTPLGSETALPADLSGATGPISSIDASLAANSSIGSAIGWASPAGNVTVVPEPSSLWLTVLGGLAALAFNWRKMLALSIVRNRAFVSVRSQPSAFQVAR
jgi:hypothetical protein